MKVCDYGTYINLLEMHFSKEELAAKEGEKDQAETPATRFKKSREQVRDFLERNNIKQKLTMIKSNMTNSQLTKINKVFKKHN